MIKIAFLGTPNIGASALNSLINNDQIEVVVSVTIPDKAIGRSHSKLQPSPVAIMSEENNIPVIKTNSINKDIDKLKQYKFDYLLTCAFGQFLSDDVLALPNKKALNVHGSLLPDGRGGAPLHWAIINGKEATGISIMEMVSEMDAGDYYSQYEIKIDDEDNVDILFDKMSNLIFEKTAEAIIEIDNGKESTKQDENKVTFWMNVKKDDAKINWENKDSKEVYNHIRGLDSKPGAWTTYEGKVVKIHKAIIWKESNACYRPGIITYIGKEGITVQTKQGKIVIKELTLEGSKRNTVENIINGNHPFKVNEKFE